MGTNKSAKTIIQEFVQRQEIQTYKDPIQIIVKVVDNQRAAHFLRPLEELHPSKRFLSPEEKEKYIFKNQVSASSRPLLSCLPGKATQIEEVENAARIDFERAIENL
jgi:hypothetical protein